MALTKVSTGMLSADVASIDLNIDANTMYIDVSNNRVGINNAAPSTALDVTGSVTADGLTTSGNILLDGSGNPTVINKTSGAGNNPLYRLQADTNYWDLQGTFSNTDDELFFMYNGSTKMAITSAGSVGIGTASVTNKLEVDGGSSPVFARISTTNAGSKVAGLILANSGKTAFNDGVKISHGGGFTTFDDLAGTTNLTINQTTGNVGIGTGSPDAQGGNQSTILNLEGSDNLVYFSGGSGGNAIDDGLAIEGVATGVSSGDKRTGSILMTRANTSTTSLDSKIAFYTTASGTHAERLRIDSSGNVGIGKVPSTKLDVQGVASTTGLTVLGGGAATGYIGKITNNSGAAGGRDGLKVETLLSDSTTKILTATSNSVDRFVVTGTGNVGIGTTSPTNFLGGKVTEIANSDTTGTTADNQDLIVKSVNRFCAISVIGKNTGGSQLNFGDENDREVGGVRYDHSNDYLETRVNGAERTRIDSSGNLLVSGTSLTEDDHWHTKDGICYSYRASGVGRVHNQFFNAGSLRGEITSSAGGATLYTSLSDSRLKENITDAVDAGSTIDALQVRQFDMIGGAHHDYGMVAQELALVCPDSVYQPEDPEKMMSVDYSKLVPMLVKEIQSLRARVAQLES